MKHSKETSGLSKGTHWRATYYLLDLLADGLRPTFDLLTPPPSVILVAGDLDLRPEPSPGSRRFDLALEPYPLVERLKLWGVDQWIVFIELQDIEVGSLLQKGRVPSLALDLAS